LSVKIGIKHFVLSLLAVMSSFVTGTRIVAQATPQIPTPKFVHPGVPLTITDLDNVSQMIQLQRQPWYGGYQQLVADGHSQLTYTMQGPFQEVDRNLGGTGVNVNLTQWRSDMTAIGNMSRLWYYTGNAAYAQKAHDILLAWATTQTVFGGYESNLDMGDYIHQFVTGADILRGTWPGWTANDTTTVKNFFTNVYYPGAGIGVIGPANKGLYTLVDGIYLSLFNDDQATYASVMTDFLQATQSGMRNTLATGEVGESLRDSGHAYDEVFCLARIAEANWSQGVDIYTMLENRLLGTGEYHTRADYFALGATVIYGEQWVPDGSNDNYYLTPPTQGFTGVRVGVNLLRGAYNTRLGLPTPWMDLATQWTTDDYVSFSFEKVTDKSTATPVAYNYPAIASVSTGLADADIGDASNALGSSHFQNGTWTVTGAGSTIFTDYNFTPAVHPDNFHFVYLPITGDGTFIAKVNAPPVGGSYDAMAGVAVRDTLSGIPNVGGEIGLSPVQNTPSVGQEIFAQTVMHGWNSMYGGGNFEDKYFNNGCVSTFCDWLPYSTIANGYWFKVERLGRWLNLSISPDGTSWATVNSGSFTSFPDTMYYGLLVSSGVSGSRISASFSHVSASIGDGNGLVTVPDAPLNIVGGVSGSTAVLRWLPSFGATTYNVKRSTSASGPFTTVGSGVAGTTYTDSGLTDVGTYYYVVSAINSAGESADSPADSLSFSGLPQAPVLTGAAAIQQSRLTWTDPIYGVNSPLSFNVKRSLTSGGPYTTIAQVTWTLPSSTRIGNSYGDAPIKNGTTYYYVVSTVDAQGESPNSNEVAVTPNAVLALSIDFQGGNTSVMAPTETAGWIPETTWNSAPNVTGSASSLVLNNGTVTTSSVSWSALGTGSTTVLDTAGDSRMMKGFLNSGLGNPAIVDVNNIPDAVVQAGYDVYVYVDGDNPNNNVTDITVSGTTQSVTSLGGVNYFGDYFQNNYNNAGNFVVFKGLSSSSLEVVVQPDLNSVDGRGSPVNGIQIISHALDPLYHPVLPTAPVVTGAPENGAVGLSWPFTPTGTAALGVTQFNIKRSQTSGGPYTVIGQVNQNTSSGSLGNSYTDTTVVNGQTYYYVVTAVNFNGESPNSNEVQETPFVRQAISIDFQGGSTTNGTPSSMRPQESAGWIPFYNWNSVAGASGTASALYLNDGTTTGASVTWSSPNTWSTPITEQLGDARMMKGYIDSAPGKSSSVQVANLPSAFVTSGYDVYVYVDGDNGANSDTGQYTLAANTLSALDRSGVNFSGQYYQGDNGGSNYVVFRNINTPSFTLSAAPLSTDGAGGRAPINGISIVSYAVGVNEPLNTPAALVVTATPANNTVGLSWPYNPSTLGISIATSFTVSRSLTSGGPYTAVGTVPWSTAVGNLGNSYLDTTAENGTTYYYVVNGSNSAGKGQNSAEVSVTPYNPEAVSVDFQGGSSSNGTPTAMQSQETAGWVPVSRWNNAGGASGSASNLLQSDGTATGVSATWSSVNTWSTPIKETAGDARMMKGYLDCPGGKTTTIKLNSLPSAYVSSGYDVYVYIDGDNGANKKTGQYTLSGTTLGGVDSGGLNFAGNYFQNNNGGSNYVVFPNVTASSLTLTATPLSSDGTNGRAPIDGISIVSHIAIQASTTTTLGAVSPASPVYGQTVTVSASVASGTVIPGGSVTFTVDASPTIVSLINGVANLNLTSLAVGPHTVSAAYSGNLGFSASSVPAVNFTVGQAAPTVVWAAPAATTYGTALSPAQLNAASTLPGTFVYSPVSGTVLGAGTQTLNVTFTPSDLTDYTSTTQTVQLLVNKAATTVAPSASPTPAGQGKPVQLTATVSGAGTPSGTIALVSGSTTLCSAALNSAGVGTCSFVPSASGSLAITANYQGDANHQSSSAGLSLSVYDSSIQLQVANTQLMYPGATNVTVCVASATAATATGTIGIVDGTTLLTTQSLQGGGCAYWYISPGFAAGLHALTAVYSGDSNNSAGTSLPVAVTVNPVAVNLSASCWNASFPYGGSYSCTANLSSNAGSAPGTLNYTIDGNLNSITLNGGSAQFTISTPSTGAHTVVIRYPAQGNFASAGPVNESFTVTPASTQIQLVPSSYYQAATSPLTLNVTLNSWSAGSPTDGTVSFYDGSTLLGTLPAGSSVSYPVSSRTAGTHSYSATYTPGGSGNFSQVTSNSVNVQLMM
jgi:fibronectin type 3 domain-containing protein